MVEGEELCHSNNLKTAKSISAEGPEQAQLILIEVAPCCGMYRTLLDRALRAPCILQKKQRRCGAKSEETGVNIAAVKV